MHKEGLETYNDSIKILSTSIRQHKDIEITIIGICIFITTYTTN